MIVARQNVSEIVKTVQRKEEHAPGQPGEEHEHQVERNRGEQRCQDEQRSRQHFQLGADARTSTPGCDQDSSAGFSPLHTIRSLAAELEETAAALRARIRENLPSAALLSSGWLQRW